VSTLLILSALIEAAGRDCVPLPAQCLTPLPAEAWVAIISEAIFSPAVMLDTFANRLLREPLVHFLAIGVAVFALYGLSDDRSATPANNLIVITPQQVERLAEQYEAVWRRAPTEAERVRLIEELVREEVYYREALARTGKKIAGSGIA
jgi:hypothetical protein